MSYKGHLALSRRTGSRSSDYGGGHSSGYSSGGHSSGYGGGGHSSGYGGHGGSDYGGHGGSGYGHASSGYGYHASGGHYKNHCPGIPIALLLITLAGIGKKNTIRPLALGFLLLFTCVINSFHRLTSFFSMKKNNFLFS
jgi:hypothetical protein